MEELVGNAIFIILSIKEGQNFNYFREPLIISCSLNGHTLRTDPVGPANAPQFDSELIWETDKKALRSLRLQNVPLKLRLQVGGKDTRGYLSLSLLSARPCPTGRPLPLQAGHGWHRILGAKGSPELLLRLTLRDSLEPLPPTPQSKRDPADSAKRRPIAHQSQYPHSQDGTLKVPMAGLEDLSIYTSRSISSKRSLKSRPGLSSTLEDGVNISKEPTRDVEVLNSNREITFIDTNAEISPEKNNVVFVLDLNSENTTPNKNAIENKELENRNESAVTVDKNQQKDIPSTSELKIEELPTQKSNTEDVPTLNLNIEEDDHSETFDSHETFERKVAEAKERPSAVCSARVHCSCERGNSTVSPPQVTGRLSPDSRREVLLSAVNQLEDWKEQQQEIFRSRMKQREAEVLQQLGREWEERRRLEEMRLAAHLQHSQDLAARLNSAADQLSHRQNKLKSARDDLETLYISKYHQLNEASKRMEDDFTNEIKNHDKKFSQLEIKFTFAEKENADLKEKLRRQEEEVKSWKNCCNAKDQVALRVQADMEGLKERLENSQRSERHFRERWDAAARLLQMQKTRDTYRLHQILQDEESMLQQERLTLQSLGDVLSTFHQT